MLASSRRGTEDPGQIADVLCDQEVVLHETLDVFQAGVLHIAEAFEQVLALDVKGQPLFRTSQ